MDSEKPGWNDAMNGLPAIFGSGVSETIALKRLVNFLKESLTTLKLDLIHLPQTIMNRLMKKIVYLLIQPKKKSIPLNS